MIVLDVLFTHQTAVEHDQLCENRDDLDQDLENVRTMPLGFGRAHWY